MWEMPKKRKKALNMIVFSRKAGAIIKRKNRAQQRWNEIMECFNEYSVLLKNAKGKSRTFAENRMLLLALNVALRRNIKLTEDKRKIS